MILRDLNEEKLTAPRCRDVELRKRSVGGARLKMQVAAL